MTFRQMMRAKLAATVDEVVQRRNDELLRQFDTRIAELREVLRQEIRDETRRQTDRVVDRMRDLEVRMRRDIVFAGEQRAAQESSEFAIRHMSSAKQFGHPHETLEHGLSLAPAGGLALEFGVFSGTTLKLISAARDGTQVYGFDSFDGLPDHWRHGFPAGSFQLDGPPDVPGAELVVGLFEDTLPGFLDGKAGPVDFVHVDGDLYSSAKTVLDLVGPRLRAGSVIVFDEFFNYPGWQEHEYKAWQEYVGRTGVRFSYRAFTWDNEQVVVQISD
jgi:hypothetical protein